MSRNKGKNTPRQTLTGVQRELRSIIRRRESLRRPISGFEILHNAPAARPCYRVVFDNNPPKNISGLVYRSRTTTLPDERIQDDVLSLAQSVWHLKDRLRRWAKAQNIQIDIEKLASQNVNLMVCADLANMKKHGGTGKWSRLSPYISEVHFDTSKSGLLELYYDGTAKEKQLHVTNPNPIAYRVKIMTKPEDKDEEKVVAEDAVAYIWEAFEYWLPIIKDLGVLKPDNAESGALIKILYGS